MGKSFFREVAPCTQGERFEGRLQKLLKAEVEGSDVFDYEFKFLWGTRRVRIRLLVDGESNAWGFVNGVISKLPINVVKRFAAK